MYYLGWMIVIVIYMLWKRDIRKAHEAIKALKESLQSERGEIESLRKKYEHLIKSQPNKFISNK
ncbi:MAG: hypothetical protein L3V56_04860 [Candidatus Magnetoovum sp. WYHC-5]|nr:hypothetical protein [Candidatus Magnetoovum sp. WYHC-5]